LTVHRFPIDPHDRAAHLESVRNIVAARGRISAAEEECYLRHSIHSSALLGALNERAGDFDAIVVGPYLFGLTHDVARASPERTLLLPCFHDEPMAKLKAWPAAYGQVGGLLLHSAEEAELTLGRLGVNGANAIEVGTLVNTERAHASAAPATRDYMVYCGRYSDQKNVPLLLDWMGRFQQQRPGRLDLVCMGAGEVPLPRVPWLCDLGRVDESRKRAILAGARALVQLSRQESLSLVALEAWAQETPVIVHADCAVLAAQVRRAQGGIAVANEEAFVRALDDVADSRGAWGRNGRAYVEERYASRELFLDRLERAIANLEVPLREQMRRRGLERAKCCDRAAWRVALGRIVDDLFDAAPRPYKAALAIRPLHDEIDAVAGARTSLIAVRIENEGTHAAVATGPGRTVLQVEVCDPRNDSIVGTEITELPSLLVPGATLTAMVRVPVPRECRAYELRLSVADWGSARVRLNVGEATGTSGLMPLVGDVRRLLLDARSVQRLPTDYVDVTQGWFARAKRWIKQKLLHNFKHAYVDVASRQQSHLNGQLVAAALQLSECCAALDHAVRGLQRQLAEIEARDNVHVGSRSERTSVTQGGIDR
jgi:glycosyltransferase involved in cell wall biosynthesis